jgi:hypothetical protein
MRWARSGPMRPDGVNDVPVNDVPILVCDSGKRLRAPGAKPGRVGRCPSCGGTMRVPESVSPRPVAARPEPAEEEAPEWPTTPRAVPPGKKRRKKRDRPGSETAIWDGFVKAPKQLETTIQESLLYPFWGAQGVVFLVVFPPILWVVSIVNITVVLALLGAGGSQTVSWARLLLGLPFYTLPAAVLGYVLLYLGRVLASTAAGDIHPPRWPEFEFSSILFGLGRWLWAGFVGGVVGGIPAMFYWIRCGDIDLFDSIILTELLAVGSIYALMALLAAILHEDLLAANPFTVLGAIRRVGWSYAQPCLLCGFAILPAATILVASFKVENPAASAFLFWVFWVLALYEAMVVFRVLGLFYHRHAQVLGWFRGRTRWGV